MKNQALFSLKDKSKKLKCCLLQFLFGTLRVKTYFFNNNKKKQCFQIHCFFKEAILMRFLNK